MIALHCRPLVIADLDEALNLDMACFGGLWSRGGYQREISSPNSDLQVLVVEDAPKGTARVIGLGCVWAILDEAHITLLGIAPTYRKQGLGQWLLLRLLQLACDLQLSHATLEVRASNQVAQKLYQKLGFQVAGERRGYYGDGENALVLWRGGLQNPLFKTSLQAWEAQTLDKLTRFGWSPARTANA